MRILVIGGRGFVGAVSFVELLSQQVKVENIIIPSILGISTDKN